MVSFKKMQKCSNYNNRRKAWKFFYPEGNGNAKKGYVLHHIDPTWKYNDVERYQQWNVEDLEMLTFSEHLKRHYEIEPERFSQCGENNNMFGKHHSERTKELLKNQKIGNDYFKGHKHSQESIEKCRLANTGKRYPGYHWWTNGTIIIRAKECPEGFVSGRRK